MSTDNTLREIFDLVAASRQPKRLRTVFNALSEPRVQELKTLLQEALSITDVKENHARTESFHLALAAIAKYEGLPKMVDEYTVSPQFAVKTGTQKPNPQREHVLSRMQRRLYNQLNSGK